MIGEQWNWGIQSHCLGLHKDLVTQLKFWMLKSFIRSSPKFTKFAYASNRHVRPGSRLSSRNFSPIMFILFLGLFNSIQLGEHLTTVCSQPNRWCQDTYNLPLLDGGLAISPQREVAYMVVWLRPSVITWPFSSFVCFPIIMDQIKDVPRCKHVSLHIWFTEDTQLF